MGLLTPRQRSTLTDLQSGHVLLRRRRGADLLSVAPGNTRWTTREPRTTANGLVFRGLARWEPAQPGKVARFRLVLTTPEVPHD